MPDEFARACQNATLLDSRLNLKLRCHELATHSVHFDTFCYQLSCKLIFQVDNNLLVIFLTFSQFQFYLSTLIAFNAVSHHLH